MAKIKAKKAKAQTEGDENNEICASNPIPITENEDEHNSPSVSHSKGKTKKKEKTKKLNKNRIEPSNEDGPQEEKSNFNPIEARQEEEVKGHKKKKKKNNEEEENKREEKEQNDGCHLPGQKHERPHERDPLRVFLEVLHQQLPDSDLATTWMMERGLLPPEEATNVYERQLKENEMQGLVVSPTPAVSLKKASKVHSKKLDKASPNTISKAKKRKVSENTWDDDLISSKKKKT